MKNVERQFHDRIYQREKPLPHVDVEDVRRTLLQPCYESGNDRYSDNKQIFHNLIQSHGGWANKNVLDYACGYGLWATYYAMTGARTASGFDLSETAVRLGHQRVLGQGLQENVFLMVMDASNLGYHDEAFDLVIGHGVIHHVIKYPGIFQEIHRVMKPQGKAFFLEGLADFPIFNLWWKIKGPVPQGDVPIFSKEIRAMTKMFTKVEIIDDNLIYSLKTFLYKNNASKFRRKLLRSCKTLDKMLFAYYPSLRRWGSFSYIILTK